MQDELDNMNDELSFKELLNKMARYCAYHERSSGDVRNKLVRYGMVPEMMNRIMSQLEKEGFLNDKRYSNSYVNGKLWNNNWGKIKIRLGLRERGISEENIEEVLGKINEKEYRALIKKLILSKSKRIEDSSFIKKNKIARFLLSRGFENHLIWEELENIKF
jgi:regulatory protein